MSVVVIIFNKISKLNNINNNNNYYTIIYIFLLINLVFIKYYADKYGNMVTFSLSAHDSVHLT